MKIVRLTENNAADAYFDNTFNDEINLEPFSEVALASVAVNVNPSSVEVNGTNNEIYISQIGPITLANGSYDLANYEALFFDMESSINDTQGNGLADLAESSVPNNEVGRQWIVSNNIKKTGFTDEGKVSIGYRCANYDGPAPEAYVGEQISITGTGLEATVKRDGGTAGDLDAYLASKEPLTWGCGRFYVNLQTLADPGNTDEGVFIGLSFTDHAKEKTTPTIEECAFGIRASRPGEVYQLNQEDVEYADDDGGTAGHQVAVSDYIGFERIEGKIYAVQYPTGASPNDRYLLTAADDAGADTALDWSYSENRATPLFPVIIMLGSAPDAIVDRVQLSPDAFRLFTAKNAPYTPETGATKGLVGMQNNGQDSSIHLSLQNGSDTSTLTTYLGYTNERQPTSGNAVFTNAEGSFTAKNTVFTSSLKGQGYYIELMTGTCEGYDGETGQRKNILAVIPESDSDDKLLFQPAFPIFLEMNNSHPLILRNIRARLLQTDGSNLRVQGFNSMTLLYKSGKSK